MFHIESVGDSEKHVHRYLSTIELPEIGNYSTSIFYDDGSSIIYPIVATRDEAIVQHYNAASFYGFNSINIKGKQNG